MNYLTAEQVLFLHARLIDETGGSHGVHDIHLLLPALGRPQGSFDGVELYPDIFTKAAALMDSLVRNHPFVDGNKRTGFAAAGLFLIQNGYKLTASNDVVLQFALNVTKAGNNIEDMASWFRMNSEPL